MKFFIASALLAVGYTASRLARSQQVSNDAREAIDAIPEAVSGVAALRIKPYEPDIDASRSDSTTPGELNFDIGILSRKNQEEWDTSFVNSRRLQASSCTSGSVVCDNGFNAADLLQTCAVACAPDKCCVGTSACDNFNGEVCMDGESCMGDQACFNATITSVVKGCSGTDACLRAGYNGTIGLVDNSCQGNSACAEAAASGYYIDDAGVVCYACYYYGGTINDITDSCIGDKSCYATARFQGYVGSILNSCHGTSDSCYSAGGYGGSIDSITGSCNGKYACKYTAETYGKIETISESCVGEYACELAAAYYGNITGFRLACNAASACYKLNSGPKEGKKENAPAPIESVLDNCCNAADACAYQITLPGECVAPSTSPSTSPSTLPSESPSKSPSTSPSDSPSASPTESAAPSVMPSTSEPTAAPTKIPTGRPTTAKPTVMATSAKPTVMATSAKPTTSAPTGPEKNESNAKAAKNGKGDKAGKEAKEGKEGKKGKTDPAIDVATLVEEREGGDENSSKFGFAVERKRVHASGGGENNPGLRSASDKNRV